MSVPFFERGIVPGGNREIEREAVPSDTNISGRGTRLKRRPSFSPPGEGSGVASMKNKGRSRPHEKGDKRRPIEKPKTKRQKKIEGNGGGSKK